MKYEWITIDPNPMMAGKLAEKSTQRRYEYKRKKEEQKPWCEGLKEHVDTTEEPLLRLEIPKPKKESKE